jgi:hypothetical protein
MIKKTPLPTNLKAKLYPYQEIGFNWLLKNIQNKEGCILADDMGLGKTLQIISVLLHLKNINYINYKQKVLIIVPLSLIKNWLNEFEKFAPNIKIHIYHDNFDNAKRKIIDDCEVIITAYSMILQDFKEFDIDWLFLILDEAQKIKNPKIETTHKITSIKALHKIALTGTPFENNLYDYYSLFNFINPNYLGNLQYFKNYFYKPIANGDKKSLKAFTKITKPYVLRRLKTDKKILPQFPKKTIKIHYCKLTQEQTKLYKDIIDIPDGAHKKERGYHLGDIQLLKQICNHPSQMSNDITNINIKQSGKMMILADLLTGELKNEKVVIVTQYVRGEFLVKLFQKELNSNILFLHGGCTLEQRNDLICDFQNPLSNVKILIISLKAGGVGINLTSAKHIIIFDLWWNYAVEKQAIDRIYRIGQTRNVIVHRFITINTIEEYMNEKIKFKKKKSESIVKSYNALKIIEPLTELEREDLLHKNKVYIDENYNSQTIFEDNKVTIKANYTHKKTNLMILNFIKPLQLKNFNYNKFIFIDNQLFNKQLLYYKFRINPRILYKNILPYPGKEYTCIQTTLPNNLLSFYIHGSKNYLLLDNINAKFLKHSTNYMNKYTDIIFINLSKIIKQDNNFNKIAEVISICYNFIKPKNTEYIEMPKITIHLITKLKGNHIYQNENSHAIKNKLLHAFKKETKEIQYKNNHHFLIIELTVSASKQHLHNELIHYIENLVKSEKGLCTFHHTIIQRFICYDYNRHFDKNIYLKNISMILKRFLEKNATKKHLYEKWSNISLQGNGFRKLPFEFYGYVAKCKESAIEFYKMCDDKTIKKFETLNFDIKDIFKYNLETKLNNSENENEN